MLGNASVSAILAELSKGATVTSGTFLVHDTAMAHAHTDDVVTLLTILACAPRTSSISQGGGVAPGRAGDRRPCRHTLK